MVGRIVPTQQCISRSLATATIDVITVRIANAGLGVPGSPCSTRSVILYVPRRLWNILRSALWLARGGGMRGLLHHTQLRIMHAQAACSALGILGSLCSSSHWVDAIPWVRNTEEVIG